MRAVIHPITTLFFLAVTASACGDGTSPSASTATPDAAPDCEGGACDDGCGALTCAAGECVVADDGAARCVCDEGWSGESCDVCAEGFSGAQCLPCQCQLGQCDAEGACQCEEGFTGELCDEIDHADPPAAMRVEVDKEGETRTLVLDRYNIRAGGSMTVKTVPARGPNITHEDLDEAVRTYRGYCEEEPDAIVSALVLPSGGFRYRVHKGNPHEDWAFIPEEELEASAEVERSYGLIAGTPSPRSGQPMAGASFTAQNPNGGQIYNEVYRAHVGLIINKTFIEARGFDTQTIVRKAESSLSRSNHATLRDALVETVISGVLIREDRDVDFEQGYQEFTTRFGGTFPNTVMTLTNEGGSGLTYLCMNGHENGDPEINRLSVGKSGPNDDGAWYGVFRHEYGHSLGSNHYEGGAPEGPTIMSGNALSRFSGYEVQAMVDCRQTPNGDAANFNEALGHYEDYPIPPYARVDDRITHAAAEGELTVDAMANDHDVNGEDIAIAGFDGRTGLGGEVALRPGAGPEGRDLLAYLPPEDLSAEVVVDECPEGTSLALDCTSCVPETSDACETTSDCEGSSVCVSGACRLAPGCAEGALLSACGQPCPGPQMVLWLDSSDLASMTDTAGARGQDLTHGAEIVRWGDRSGSGNDAVVFAEGRAPALQREGERTMAQRPTLAFTADFMEVRGLDVRPENMGALTTVAVLRGAPGVVVWVQQQNGFEKRQHSAKGIIADAPSLSTVTVTDQTERYWGNRVEQDDSPQQRLVMPGEAGVGIGALLYSGQGYEGAYHQDFTLAELIVFEGPLGPEDLASIENHLVAKWQVSLRDKFWYTIVDTSGLESKAPIFVDLR